MAATPKSENTAVPEPDATGGKGRATPSRREQEAARRKPLVPSDRRAASKQNRATMAAERDRARAGMAAGEEKYLPLRDKGPQKRFVRDVVDARWNAGELLMPILVLVILTWFLPQAVVEWVFLGFWAFFLLVVADSIWLGFQVKRRLSAKFGADRLERGVRWYAAMRALQMRTLRLPKPQVGRGQYPA